MAAKKMSKAQFEKSRFDNDKGVKEGSPADKKRDKVQMAKANKGRK